MNTTYHDLDWLLENLLSKTPGTRHALVLSKDGLKLCHTRGLTVDQARTRLRSSSAKAASAAPSIVMHAMTPSTVSATGAAR